MRRLLLVSVPGIAALIAAEIAIRGAHPIAPPRAMVLEPIPVLPESHTSSTSTSTLALARLESRARMLSMMMEPCEPARRLIASADDYVDEHPDSAGALVLLGDALSLQDGGPPMPRRQAEGSLANQSCTSTVASRHAKRPDDARAAATRIDPALEVGPPLMWLGTVHVQDGELRCKRARDALERGDSFEAMRELRWVDYLSMDAAMALCNPDVRDGLARDLAKAPPPRRPFTARTPEEALGTLEAAALSSDLVRFRTTLSKELFNRERTEGACGQYADAQDPFLMCVLDDVIGEEHLSPTCTAMDKKHSRCVTGGHSVTLEKRAGRFVILSTEPL